MPTKKVSVKVTAPEPEAPAPSRKPTGPCTACNGIGVKDGLPDATELCPVCKGSGQV